MFQDEPVGLSGTGFNTESTASDLIKLQAAGEGGGFIPGLNHYLAHVFFPQGQRTVEEYKSPSILRVTCLVHQSPRYLYN